MTAYWVAIVFLVAALILAAYVDWRAADRLRTAREQRDAARWEMAEWRRRAVDAEVRDSASVLDEATFAVAALRDADRKRGAM